MYDVRGAQHIGQRCHCVVARQQRDIVDGLPHGQAAAKI